MARANREITTTVRKAKRPSVIQSPPAVDKKDLLARSSFGFSILYSNWLRLLSEIHAPKTDEEMNDLIERLTDCSLAVCTAPAPLWYHVRDKFSVIERELATVTADGMTPDNRLIVMLAGLKADLLRFNAVPDDEGES